MTESPKRKAIIALNHTNKRNKNQTHHGPSSQQIKDSNDIRLCYPETIKINTSKEEKQLCMGCHSTSLFPKLRTILQRPEKEGEKMLKHLSISLLKNWFKLKENGITCNRKIKLFFPFMSRRV